MTTITALPPVPQPADDVGTFNTKAFAFVAALVQFVTETNAVAGETNTAAGAAATSAAAALVSKLAALASETAALASAQSAAASAGASLWVAGSYTTGTPVYSPTSSLVYRRKSPGGASPTDPANDPTNWSLAIIAAPLYRPETGATVNAEVNVEHGLRRAGVQEVVMPAAPSVGDIFWVCVENGRTDNFLTTGGAKVNGEDQATLTLDDPYAAVRCRYTGSSYGWSI